MSAPDTPMNDHYNQLILAAATNMARARVLSCEDIIDSESMQPSFHNFGVTIPFEHALTIECEFIRVMSYHGFNCNFDSMETMRISKGDHWALVLPRALESTFSDTTINAIIQNYEHECRNDNRR